ncbi:alpha/beta hydrolase [Bacillus cereus]|uniref:alpha/beta fold hydrolase n=1 Tax=Bacillus TaxID=1386 RepID=UPI00068AE2D4|nr:alpha/beta hydrolase [Bacillus sp. UNC322MFChir4.1]
MKEYTVNTKGVKIKAYEYSQNGEPILFLHYMGGSAAIWRSIVPKFTEEYRVIAIDIRGHGNTDHPENGYQLETLVEDIREVLDVLGIHKTHIVGSSLGCYVGTMFASTYADRVISLVNSEGALVNHSGDGGLYTESKEEHINKCFSNPEQEFDSREDLIQYMKKTWLPWNTNRALVMEDYKPRELPNGKVTFVSKKENMRQIAEDLYDRRLEDLYDHVQCRVLFLPAEKEGDLNKKLAFIKNVECKLSESKTVVIPGSSHAMMFDHAAELVREIKVFLNSSYKLT